MSSVFAFRYEIGGNLAPIESPIAPDENITRGLRQIGFFPAGELGNQDTIHLHVYSSKEEHDRWIIAAGYALSCCLIEVVGWPNFLDAMARYSRDFPTPAKEPAPKRTEAK